MINLSNFNIILFLTFSIISRILSIYFFGDSRIDNEWGIMLNNLVDHNILSFRSVEGVPVPNLFMPPLYPIFLYLIKLTFKDYVFFINAVLIIQLILSVASIIILFKILKQIFYKQLSLIGTVVYAFFPINIYAVSQISSITLQIFLINIFFLYFVKIFKKPNLKYILIFSIVSALLILLRGEFFVFVLFSHIYLLLKHKCLKKIIISILLIIIFISPYLHRSYDIFGQITITKSFGFNLLKGNHPGTSVEGVGLFGDEDNLTLDTRAKLNELNEMGPIKEHDLLKDQIFLDQAITFIKKDPLRYLKLYIQKFFAFLFFDINSSYLNYFSIFHLLPKILLSLTTIGGIFISISLSKNIINYFILFYVGNIGLFSFFFILPRYSLSLLTVQIILSLFFVEKIQKKINYKNHEKFR